MHPTLLGILVVLGFASAVKNAVLVLRAREILGVGEAAFGGFVLVSAIGALAGSQTAAALAARIGRGRTLVLSEIVEGAASPAAAVTTSPYLGAAALALSGWAVLVWNVVAGALRQRITPNEMLGRTVGIYRVVTWGAMPLGALAGATVVSAVGLRAPYVIAGLLLSLTGAWAARRLANRLLEEATAEADTAAAPAEGRPDHANR